MAAKHGSARMGIDIAHGLQIEIHHTYVFIEDEGGGKRLHIVLTDPNTPHAPPPHIPAPDDMAQGSSFIFIETNAGKLPCCREGHLAGCGHPTTGSALAFQED